MANYARLFGGEDDVSTSDTTNGVVSPTSAATAAAADVVSSGVDGSTTANMIELQRREAQYIGLYGGLLSQSKNFFTRRQSLKLLAELLLDRTNFNIMMKFISSKHNLKLVMNL